MKFLKTYFLSLFFLGLFLTLAYFLYSNGGVNAISALNEKIFYFIFNAKFVPESFLTVVSFFGDTSTVFVFSVIIFIFLFYTGRKKEALVFGIFMILSQAVRLFIDYYFSFSRPGLNTVSCNSFILPSFPSGHVLATVILTGFLFIFSRQHKGFWLFFAVVMISIMALSRIQLGCHWPLDAAGSVLFGLAVITAARSFLKETSKI